MGRAVPHRAPPDGVLPNGNYRLTDLKDRRRREEVSGDWLRLYVYRLTDLKDRRRREEVSGDRLRSNPAPDEFLVERILERRGTSRDRQYQ